MPRTILCVDDDRNLCQILAKALDGEGYCVRTAHDGDAALLAFRSEPPDLLLLDLLLPRRDGFDVLAEVRRGGGTAAETPAIVLTGCTRTPEYVQRAESLRAAAFLTKPVKLDTLLETVRKHLDGVPAMAAAAAPDTGRRRPRSLTGFLDELPFPSLLHHLHGLRATGTLLLRNGRKKKGLQIRDGRPAAVKSNLVSECLGNLLLKMGRIDQKALAESLRRVQRGEGLQGEILVAMAALDEEEVSSVLRVQAEEKLFEVFEWDAGGFEFHRGGELKGGNALALDRSPADIILDGVRGRFPLPRVDTYLTVYARHRLVMSESPFYQFQEVALGPEHEALLAGLDRAPRLVDICTDESSKRVIYGLLCAELLDLRAPDWRPAPRPAKASAEGGRKARPAAPAPDDEGIRSELASMTARMRGRNYFEVLGVDATTADDNAVREAYVELAKRTHPDRFRANGESVRRLAEEIFGIISQAHAALSDADTRAAYRLELARGERDAAQLEEGRQAVAAEEHFKKGEAALKNKRYPKAFEHFQTATEIYPDEPEYLAHMAWARFLASPDDAAARDVAVQELRRAAKAAPNSVKPIVFLGRLCKAVGKDGAAEKLFTKAIGIRSDCVEALRELRLMNMRREKSKGLVRRLLRR